MNTPSFVSPVTLAATSTFCGVPVAPSPVAPPCAPRVAVPPHRAATMVAAPERDSTTTTLAKTASVLLPEKLSEEGISLLATHFHVVKKLGMTPEELLAEIPNHEAIIIRSGTKMTRELITAATNLKVIGRAGVGVDNIDIPAATERGVLVVNAPTGNCVAAAEHTIALLTSMARLIAPADATIKAGGWNRSAYVGASLVDKTLGVIGLGRIGREVTRRARGLGMKVIASDPFASEETAEALGAKLAPFEEVVSTSDFLTLHIPLLDSTRNLIDAAALASMKPGARIINAARGGIVNEVALLDALESGHIAGAALDCFENEPPHKFPDSVSEKIANHPKVLATPHLGASTREAQEDVAVEIATAVRDTLNGDMVGTMINAPAISPTLLKLLKPRAMLCTALGRMTFFLSRASLQGEVKIDYHIPDATEDTRILRAGLIKGLVEPAMGISVSIVNADNVAKTAGMNLTEVNHMSATGEQGSEVKVTVKNAPVIEGRVSQNVPHVTKIGRFEVDMRLDGITMIYSQDDRPGQLGRIGSLLGENGVNISFMTLGRDSSSSKALVLLGLDSHPSADIVSKVDEIINDDEVKPIVIEF